MPLTYVIPRKDIKPTAKELIKRFKHLPGVLAADATRLTNTPWQYLKVKYTEYIALTNNLSPMPSYTFETLKTQLDARATPVELGLQPK